MILNRTCAAVATCLALATPGVAQDVLDTITGTLDLDPAIWYVKTGGDASSGWKWVGNEVEIRLDGRVRRDADAVAEGGLTILMRTQGNPTEMNVDEFTFRYLSEDGVVYSADDENADLRIEALFISDDEMAIAGSFAGRLIQGGAEDLVIRDAVNDVTVDGNFQATVPRLSSD